MNYAGESVPDTSIVTNNGGRPRASRRPLAIVGMHPKGLELTPWDDDGLEIWLFNEAAQKVEKYPRWDALLQIHRPEVYTSLDNWVNKDHWEWLQQDHGDKRIYMIDVDPRVPNSVKYPLEGVLSLTPYHYLRSSPAMALALAIYLGYTDISLYGSELSSNTEYAYQAINYAFWIGFAHGHGIDLKLRCWQSEFDQPLYGYEGEAQIDRGYFEERFAEQERAWNTSEKTLRTMKEQLDQAMLKAEFDKVGRLSLELQDAALAAGESSGAMAEAGRYSTYVGEISRQEFERVSARALKDGEKVRENMWHAGGKCEYVWNAWRLTGKLDALNQLRAFLRDRTKLAYDTGAMLGIYRENILYMHKYDEVVTAFGGNRALYQVSRPESVDSKEIVMGSVLSLEDVVK
jgi:hypothetical protein